MRPLVRGLIFAEPGRRLQQEPPALVLGRSPGENMWPQWPGRSVEASVAPLGERRTTRVNGR